jgi:Uma2 family endonuclease
VTERFKGDATYDDLVAAPDDKIAEIVAGDLYLSPRPHLRHSHILSGLAADLHGSFDRGKTGPEGWWILIEPELHLFGDVLVPDIAGWKRERLPAIPDAAAMELAPDWVCEILSPSTARFDRLQKMPRYALAGVAHLWIIDPGPRRLEVYERAGGEWSLVQTHTGESIVSAPPFGDGPVDLGRLWP